VPKVSRKMGTRSKGDERARLSGPSSGPRTREPAAAAAPETPRAADLGPGIKRASQAQAIDIILADALADDEGTGLGCLGSMRYGKTYFMDRVHKAMLEKGVAERLLVHDCKKAEPQFAGAVVSGWQDFVSRAAELEGEPVIVFHHPDLMARPTLQEVCEVALAMAQDKLRVVVCADEVYKGTNGFQGWLKPKADPDGSEPPALYPLIIREGGSQHLSHTWGTQVPQQLPTECKVLTRSVAIFHSEGLAAEAAMAHFRLGPEAPELLRKLGRGEFLLYCQGQDWDRTVYGPE